MPLFHPSNRDRNDRTRTLYARYEIAYTVVDFLAAACFLIGSFLFFSDATQYAATWLFVAGSLAFAAKPTIRLIREIHLYRMGKLETLAERYDD